MRAVFYILLFLSSIFCFAQKPTFKGQGPIKIVPTDSKPTQKQWKGTFNVDGVYFSNDFEGARLNGIIKTTDSTYVALITSENTPINPSPWYAFKVWSDTQRKIDITLTYQDGAKHRYYPKLSTDGNTWQSLDSLRYTAFDKGNADFGFNALPVSIKMNIDVDRNPLWIAGQELHNSKHVSQYIKELSRKPFVQEHTIGKSKEGRALKAMTIGMNKRKKMLMIISRQHPPEVTGYLAMKAFVNEIASDTKLARKFRRKYTTYVIPLMNPDGVDNGHWRHSTGGIDLNRDWQNFNQPETKAVRDFMGNRVKDTDGAFYFAIDFHSTWDDIYYTVDPKMKGNMPGLVPDWLEALKKAFPTYNPNIKPSSQMIPHAVSRNFFFIEHGTESLVFEIGDNTPRDFIIEKGKRGAETLMQLMLERL